MGLIEIFVFLSCLYLYLFIYSVFVIWIDIFNYFIPCGLVLSSSLFVTVLYFRIALPRKEDVEQVFGNDITTETSSSSNKQSDACGYTMKTIAHRGCGLDAPENSISAIRKITQEGCTAVEFDVMLTADNVPVVFHDDSLIRITCSHEKISEMTFSQVKSIDISAKHPFGKKYQNERIPSLEEMLSTCINLKLRMFIDLKGDNPKIVDTILDSYNTHPELYETAVVTSFNPFFLYQIRSRNPRIICSLAWRPYFYSYEGYSGSVGGLDARTSNPFIYWSQRFCDWLHDWALHNFLYYVIGLSAVLLHKDMITRDTIRFWKRRNIRVIGWSINLPSEKQYFERTLQIPYMTDTMISS